MRKSTSATLAGATLGCASQRDCCGSTFTPSMLDLIASGWPAVTAPAAAMAPAAATTASSATDARWRRVIACSFRGLRGPAPERDAGRERPDEERRDCEDGGQQCRGDGDDGDDDGSEPREPATEDTGPDDEDRGDRHGHCRR